MFRVKKTFRSPCMSSYVDTPTPCPPVKVVVPMIAPVFKDLKKKPKFLPGERLLKEVGIKPCESPRTEKLQCQNLRNDKDLEMFKNSIAEMVKRMR